MKKTILVTLCLLLGLFVSTTFAVEVTVLGPNQYLRTSGAPDVYTDTFSAIPGEGRLIVKNGTGDGEHRINDAISSAVILVNGVQIFGPSDFNQQVYLLESPVNLADSNSISVELASGPGSYLTIEVREEVDPPTVTLSADPETILAGESSTLTWSSTNADSCLIEPDIGNVNMSGSITVTPNETTMNTITATGPGGAVSDNVTVIVISLTVSISADPESILVGGSSVLTWSSTNADSVTIDQGIGSVDTIGSIPVSPDETTTYNITATGLGYTATASVTVTVTPIAISITSPLDGETTTGPDTKVYGTITNLTGNETGVIVNGIIAMVYGNQFVANHVPLVEGGNTITATATDTDGNTATTSITINAATTEHYISITAVTESGVSPLETTLEVEGSFSFTESSISHTGPGVVEFLDSTVENEYNVRMTTPGIYFFTAEVIDDQSNTYTDTVAIVVFDKAVLDALLKAKWDGMKMALINNNIEGALNYFHESSKEEYQEIFNFLINEISGIASAMREIELIYLEDKVAKFRIKREEEVQGQTYDITYYIYFVKGLDGLWKIESY